MASTPPAQWRIAEQFSQGKISPEKNEDCLVITPDFFGVIDGVSGSEPINGVAGGIVASRALLQAFKTCDATQDAYQFVKYATQQLQNIPHINLQAARRAAATFTVFNHARNEIWTVGDCPCRVDDTVLATTGPQQLDAITSGFRAALLRAQLGLGLLEASSIQAHDPARALMNPLLSIQSFFANNPDDPLGYGVMDGTSVPEKFIAATRVHQATTIVMTSDGYISLPLTLAEAEHDLHHTLTQDPLCIHQNIQTKCYMNTFLSFDDRSYIRLERTN